ncbi:hypothetical protein HHI36_009394 [Cryptolaemus montrouzieri]|uniref:Uncharacterized protein n=1 Tax=Cryptolaemus montrouzieri TaxID=559131 RepID=A0ABD2MVD0_9CUCU
MNILMELYFLIISVFLLFYIFLFVDCETTTISSQISTHITDDGIKERQKRDENDDDSDDEDEEVNDNDSNSREKRKKKGPKVRKVWDRWSKWSECSVSCGIGKQTRWRHCIGGECAPGEKEAQIKTCVMPPC